jgi:hypothetical protein
MPVFAAEVEVKARPLVVVPTLGHRHPSPFQPPLKSYPRFFGNLLPQNLFGRYRPPLGGSARG